MTRFSSIRRLFWTPEPPPVLALYQRFWQDENRYRTAALIRHDGQWVVLGVDNEPRGASELTLHYRLEDARFAIVEWVGKAREVNEGKVPGSIMDKIDGYRSKLR